MTEQIHIDYIRKAFQEMTTMEDFLELLNYAKPLVYGEDHYAFEMKQITYYVKNRSTLNTPETQNESSGTKLILRKNVPPLVIINQPSKVYGRTQNAVQDTRYTSFQIQKKSGKMRTIHAPVPGLKAIQATLGFVLQCIFEPHTAAMGFVRGKSIVDNARIHTGQNYVYNIDLKDFFPSIDQARVWKCLQLKPFNLTDKEVDETKAIARIKSSDLKFVTDEGVTVHYKIKDGQYKLIPDNFGYLRYLSNFIKQFPIPDFTEVTDEVELDKLKSNYREQVKSAMIQDAQKYILTEDHKKYLQRFLPLRRNIANTVAALCCTEMMVERKAKNGEWESVRRNVLPQGAPTSPVITNMICQRLDYLLTAVANRFGLRYSRYADDITFSSMHNVYQPEGDFLKELQRIILEQGFHINESKTRLQKDGYRKEVTGLLVNEKANVQNRYIKQLRMWLYYWENYGYDRAYSFFLQQYMADKANIVKGKPSMVNVIGGKLDYLRMVKGEENELYLKLRGRLNALTATNIKPKPILEEAFKAEANTNQVRITLEVYQSPEMNEKLNNSINIPKDTVLPSTIIVPNSIEQKEDAKSKLNNLYPIVHTPIKTVELLKYFTANDKDLKYSTHSWEKGKYRSYEEYIEKIKIEWKTIKD